MKPCRNCCITKDSSIFYTNNPTKISLDFIGIMNGTSSTHLGKILQEDPEILSYWHKLYKEGIANQEQHFLIYASFIIICSTMLHYT